MIRFRSEAMLAVCLVCSLLMAACGSDEPTRIGSIMDFTGDLGEYGPPMDDAIHLAAEQLNEAGASIEVISEDGATSDVVAVDAARKLVDVDGVSAIIGPLGSGFTIAVANAVTVPNQVPQISPSATAPSLTVLEDGDFLFRTAPSDAFQGVVLADLASELGYTSAGVLYINNAYGQGLSDQFAESFGALGGTVTSVPHEEGQPSYASELRQAMADSPDVLVAMSYPVSAAVYVREALDSGLADTFLFVDATKSEELLSAVGAADLDGMYGTAPDAIETEDALRFASDYEAAYGRPPGPFVPQSYDAAAIIGLAIVKADSDDSVAIRNALREVAGPPGVEIGPGVDEFKRAIEWIRDGNDVNYQGASGPVDLDGRGDVGGAIGIWKIENGQIVTQRVTTQ